MRNSARRSDTERPNESDSRTLIANVVLDGHREVTVIRIRPETCAGISRRSGPYVVAENWCFTEDGKSSSSDPTAIKRSGSPDSGSRSTCTAGGGKSSLSGRSSGRFRLPAATLVQTQKRTWNFAMSCHSARFLGFSREARIMACRSSGSSEGVAHFLVQHGFVCCEGVIHLNIIQDECGRISRMPTITRPDTQHRGRRGQCGCQRSTLTCHTRVNASKTLDSAKSAKIPTQSQSTLLHSQPFSTTPKFRRTDPQILIWL